MPASTTTRADIVSIPLVAATNFVSYEFNFVVPVPPVPARKSQAQILWMQLTYAADATVGTRVPILTLTDDAAAQVFTIASINTVAAGQVSTQSILQGALIFPLNILGFMRTIPVDGLFAFEGWTLAFFDLNGVSAGDTMTGFMQLRIS